LDTNLSQIISHFFSLRQRVFSAEKERHDPRFGADVLPDPVAEALVALSLPPTRLGGTES
jgi:hypothetical protein